MNSIQRTQRASLQELIQQVKAPKLPPESNKEKLKEIDSSSLIKSVIVI